MKTPVVFNPALGFEACLSTILKLPTGCVWQRKGVETQTDAPPETLKGLLEVLADQGKPAVLPFQKKSISLGPPDADLISDAVKHLVDEFSTTPAYANSTEVGIERVRDMHNTPDRHGFPAWAFYIKNQSDILPLAQRRTLFARDEDIYTYPPT
jgi:hypothetical protein